MARGLAILVLLVLVLSTGLAGKIVPEYYGNLSNNRWVIMNVLLAARQWNHSEIVIPPWNVHDASISTSMVQKATPGALWDMEHFTLMAAANNIKVYTPDQNTCDQLCPSYPGGADNYRDILAFKASELDILCINSEYSFHELRREVLRNSAGLEPSVIDSIDTLVWHKWYLQNIHFDWARRFLRPSPEIQLTAHRAAREIMSTYNTSYFFALHLRQGDFHHQCTYWDQKIDALTCMISADQALSTLQGVYSIPEQEVLFIAPPYPLKDLGRLCVVYRCTHRELLPSYMEETRDSPPMMIALHQYALAMQSARAFGNIYSSWSVELLANMHLAGKPADILNTVSMPQDCHET